MRPPPFRRRRWGAAATWLPPPTHARARSLQRAARHPSRSGAGSVGRWPSSGAGGRGRRQGVFAVGEDQTRSSRRSRIPRDSRRSEGGTPPPERPAAAHGGNPGAVAVPGRPAGPWDGEQCGVVHAHGRPRQADHRVLCRRPRRLPDAADISAQSADSRNSSARVSRAGDMHRRQPPPRNGSRGDNPSLSRGTPRCPLVHARLTSCCPHSADRPPQLARAATVRRARRRRASCTPVKAKSRTGRHVEALSWSGGPSRGSLRSRYRKATAGPRILCRSEPSGCWARAPPAAAGKLPDSPLVAAHARVRLPAAGHGLVVVAEVLSHSSSTGLSVGGPDLPACVSAFGMTAEWPPACMHVFDRAGYRRARRQATRGDAGDHPCCGPVVGPRSCRQCIFGPRLRSLTALPLRLAVRQQ
ncbi:hypothetical protein JOF58_000497 [Streptomyces cinnamonensis]|nr:hypothetical protein [Streptomyces virginiae]